VHPVSCPKEIELFWGQSGRPGAGRCHGVVRLPDMQQPDK
jgi:hypothetical protein